MGTLSFGVVALLPVVRSRHPLAFRLRTARVSFSVTDVPSVFKVTLLLGFLSFGRRPIILTSNGMFQKLIKIDSKVDHKVD